MGWLKRLFGKEDKDVLDEIEWMELAYGPAPAPTSEEIAWMDAPKLTFAIKEAGAAERLERFVRVSCNAPNLILHGISGKGVEGKDFRVDKVPFYIGRQAVDGILVDRENRMVAARHVMIEWKNEEWLMHVWGINSLLLDGKMVPSSSQIVLRDGMELLICGDHQDNIRITVSIEKKR